MAELTTTGVVGADAEMKETQNGAKYLAFSVRDSKSKKNDQGGWDELKGQWLRVVVWGSLAEQLFNSGVPKGSRVKIVGEFFSREFNGQNGPGYALDVTAWGVKVLSRPNESNNVSSTAHQTGAYGVPQSNQQSPQQQNQPGGWGSQPQQGNGGGWGNQPPQQQQNAPQNGAQQGNGSGYSNTNPNTNSNNGVSNPQQQGGGWNAPANDPWSTGSNPGWGNQ